jgi:protein gp37
MAHESKIEWTEATWNPWHGCHKVSQGCKNCYMFRDKARYGQDPNVVVRSKTKFYDPLKWTEPRTIFTCSWSDFFIEESDAWRDEAFAIMALTPQHTYQVLTKRAERMRDYMNDPESRVRIADLIDQYLHKVAKDPVDYANTKLYKYPHLFAESIEEREYLKPWPLPNIHLGLSVEDQKTADERIPLLLQTPAAVRWLSMEPLLGPVLLCDSCTRQNPTTCSDGTQYHPTGAGFGKDCHLENIDWVVAGGESGPDARPMHPDWLRSIRDQCTAAGVPFFFKQWGEWLPVNSQADDLGEHGDVEIFTQNGRLKGQQHDWDDYLYSVKIGKHSAGRVLDRKIWDEMPEVAA